MQSICFPRTLERAFPLKKDSYYSEGVRGRGGEPVGEKSMKVVVECLGRTWGSDSDSDVDPGLELDLDPDLDSESDLVTDFRI